MMPCEQADASRLRTLPFDPKNSTPDYRVTMMFIRRFRIMQQQQQPIPLKSVFTDSTVPTLQRSDVGKKPEEIELRQSIEKPECTSESGWTDYLDQSDSRTDSGDRRNEDSLGVSLLEDVDCREGEDPSMASDASSGPEQPAFLGRRRLKRNAASQRNRKAPRRLENEKEDDLDDTCQSNLSCESVSDDPRPAKGESKRRRVLVSDHPATTEIGDGHSDENEIEIDAGEAEICSHPRNNNDEDVRLEVLQHLIPDSRELDEEQVLDVAIDYVKSLEKKIKMFESKRLISPPAETASKTCLGALQDKGLCLFPVSMVATTS